MERYFLGLMAGTSADGIDAVGLHVRGRGDGLRARVAVHVHRPFSTSIRLRLLAVMAPAATRTEDLATLHADLGEAFARTAGEAIRQLGPRRRPVAIGLAGQTVCHLPDRRSGRTVTLQLGEPARVAARTGVITVAEFRQSDVAAGGQGAPLVPWTDWVLFRSKAISRAVQNLGGIGNVTWVPAGAAAGDCLAFDTGPGNMVIDGLVAELTGGRERMDRGGRRAARGRVLWEVVQRWMGHPFFRQPPPRTTGRELFGRPFIAAELPRLRRVSRNSDDWIATATAFTARSVAASYRRWLGVPFNAPTRQKGTVPIFEVSTPRKLPKCGSPPSVPHAASLSGPIGRRRRVRAPQPAPCEVILCGGGAENPVLAAMLSAELPEISIREIDDFGIAAQAKEAASFALLAAARLDETPGNLPQATGARRPAVLGAVIHP